MHLRKTYHERGAEKIIAIDIVRHCCFASNKSPILTLQTQAVFAEAVFAETVLRNRHGFQLLTANEDAN